MSPEKNPVAREGALDSELRKELLADLLEIDKEAGLRRQLVYNRPDIVQYAEVYILMAKLIKPKDAKKLRPNEELAEETQTHLKRMIAMRRRTMPRISKSIGDEKFWRLVEERTQDEWLEIVGYPDDLSRVPKGWATARTDLFKLSKLLNTEKPRS